MCIWKHIIKIQYVANNLWNLCQKFCILYFCHVYNPLLFTDYYNRQKQHPEFKDNRHDQSISSILRKQIGTIIIDGNETYMKPFGKIESLKYPFWATRHRK